MSLSLSPTCLSNLTTILSTPPLSVCTASSALVSSFFPILTGGGNNSSLIQPLNSYLDAVCPAPLCNNQTLVTGFTSIQASCPDFFSTFGLSPLSNVTVANYVPLLPSVKSLICLKESNATVLTNSTTSRPASPNSTEFCVTETLTTVQQLIGRPVSLSFLTSILSNSSSVTSFFNTSLLANASAICTPCTKGLYNGAISLVNSTTLRQAANLSNMTQSGVAATLMRAVGDVCGAAFVNGSQPAGIVNGTATDPTSTVSPSASGSARPSSGSRLVSPVNALVALVGLATALFL